MCPKDVNDYLEKGLYGSPQIKPEERKKYLGTYRERVFLAITLTEITESDTLSLFKKELAEHPGQLILLNSLLSATVQQTYMQLAQKTNTPFKIINTEQDKTCTDIGIVYSADSAIDIADITLNHLRTPADKQTPAPTKKLSWLQKIFKNKKA